MFWKIVRWGGTIVLIAVAVIALVLGDKKEDQAQPTVKPVSGSSFNL